MWIKGLNNRSMWIKVKNNIVCEKNIKCDMWMEYKLICEDVWTSKIILVYDEGNMYK